MCSRDLGVENTDGVWGTQTLSTCDPGPTHPHSFSYLTCPVPYHHLSSFVKPS